MNATDQHHLLIDYGRRGYVFGLPWFTSGDDETAKKSASDFIKKSNKKIDLIVARNDEYQQFAVSSSSQDIKSGKISAAAVISNFVGTESWLYALEIEGNIWLCYGKDGYIMPDGDRIFSNEDEAKAEFLRLEPARWKSIFVPSGWKKPGSFPEERQNFLLNDEVRESRPEDIFNYPVQKWMKLTSASSVGAILKTSTMLGVLGSAVFFGYGFLFPEPPGPTPVDLERSRELLAERARAEQLTKFQEFDSQKPWASLPPGEKMASVCIDAIKAMPLEASGFSTKEINCDGSTATATLERAPGAFASWLKEWAETNPQYDLDLAQDGQLAFLVVDTPALSPRGDEKLENYSLMASHLTETASIEGSNIHISDPVTYQYPDYPDYVPLFGYSSISIDTQRPDVWISSISKLHGISLESVSLDVQKMTYSLKGKIYVSNR